MQLKNSQKLRTAHSLPKKGYTLIEMAISIMVVGLLAAPAMAIYSNYTKTQMRLMTVQNIQTVLAAIQGFRQTNGIYPCPAPLNVPRVAASYGQDLCQYPAVPLVTAVAPATGACGNGVCVEASTRVAVPPFDAFHQRVVVGAVPFRELQIDEKSTYDGYGSGLVYAVTQSMNNINTLNTANGGISVHAAGGSSLINPPDSAVFLILSPGPDRKGGWTLDGAITTSCIGAAGIDTQNCNPGFEGGAPTANPLFIDSYENSIAGANHFDDQMSYFQEHTDPLWRYTPANPNNIQDLTQTDVGVGLATGTPPAATLDVTSTGALTTTAASPAATDSLIVYGNTAAGNAGQINANKICDTAGNCFDPWVIGGAAGMKCPAGQYMSGISGGAPVCLIVANVFCPNAAAPVMNGFNANGTPNCVAAPDPGCPATNESVCTANDIAVPVLNSSQTSALLGPVNVGLGGCRMVQYTCNAGVLSRTTDNNAGLCSFTSASTAVPCDCATQLGSGFGGACTGLQWSLCAGGFGPPTFDTTGCTCPGGTVTTHPNCPAPFTSTETVVTTYAPGTCAVVGTPTIDMTGCTCPAPNNGVANGATRTNYTSCPANGYNAGTPSFAQGIATPQTFSTATCTWSNTGAPVNNCSCVAPSPSTQTVLTGGPPAGTCPAGFTGTDQQNQTFDSVAGPGHCQWINSGAPFGCNCNTTAIPGTQPHDCAADPRYGALDCWNPAIPDNTTTTINARTCTPNATTVDMPLTGTCTPRTFFWLNETPTGNSYSGSLPNNANYFGSGCSCTDHRATVASPQSQICYNSDTNDKTIYHCDCQ